MTADRARDVSEAVLRGRRPASAVRLPGRSARSEGGDGP